MDTVVHNRLVSFIWSIADDCLRDVYVRGKYRDVILPMLVLTRLDALLEPTKKAVLEEVSFQKKQLKLKEFDPAGLRDASKYVFYNTSKWTLQMLKDTAVNSSQILLTNFEEYLNGYSENVKEIIEKFKLKSQIAHMSSKDVLLEVLEKFTSKDINLTSEEKTDSQGKRLPPLTNLGMGYVFEELIRKFNEENNEEAGEHFTPREVINLMTHIVFEPVKDSLDKVITVYDPACGSGGMLTESQNFIKDEDGEIRAKCDVFLYGKEINDETYAICKSDMMIKGNDPENIRVGSTLSTDEFAGMKFDFMLSNPPYGKSWATEVKYIKDGKDTIDSRFIVKLKDFWGNEEDADATPRTSDGQLLFLMEMVNKMKPLSQNPNGSRIASVHNGSSLFTGDAGGGESNIRRYLIENDYLDTIIQLPNNLFYNTGITTYIWILANHKPKARKGKVLLIDASQRYSKLRKNLGEKNCEFKSEHIEEILKCYRDFKDISRKTDDSIAAKIFENHEFGYYKVSIERPRRLKSQFSVERIADLRFDKNLLEPMKWAYEKFGEKVYSDIQVYKKEIIDYCQNSEIELNKKKEKDLFDQVKWKKHLAVYEASVQLMERLGKSEFSNFNVFAAEVNSILKELKLSLSASEKNAILNAVSWYDENAEKVIEKKLTLNKKETKEIADRFGCKVEELPYYGYFFGEKDGEFILYEQDTELRDSENVPLNESIQEYFLREVKPHVSEAWMDLDKTKIGYEISFNKYFYQHKPLRSLEEVGAEILALEEENEGLIFDILGIKK
ncbi:SAM-dependent DNA methyltransferase [Leptospira levettii]|uniref:type I restriction-modification system subunit M n=1 Tax=Leptospira levettii TaxID=2023178 RepID=UPI0010839556|nr:class I SAM-dependent DNA methyltransferase [Leptospira levettii]TGM31420.1 SAM-dependent DNA methyltransferase [Leptospira levettii]